MFNSFKGIMDLKIAIDAKIRTFWFSEGSRFPEGSIFRIDKLLEPKDSLFRKPKLGLGPVRVRIRDKVRGMIRFRVSVS